MSWDKIVALAGLIGSVCAIVFGFRKDNRASEQQVREDTMSLARIEGKMDSANRGIEDMRVEMRSQGKRIDELNERTIRNEDSCKSAHHRIDTIERRLNNE